MTLLYFTLELAIKYSKSRKKQLYHKDFIAKRGSILPYPLFMSKKNDFILDFVNINRTFACVAKRTFKKLIK